MIDAKKFLQSLNNKPIAVYGLGLSGLSTAISLKTAGANVYAWDENEEKRYQAAQSGIEITSFTDDDLSEYSALVLSPGIPLHFPVPHDIVKKARDSNVEIISDIEILHRCHHGLKTIGITGTNGKSTTTALIHHILNENKIKNVMGGNIGKPVLDMNLPSKGAIVLELSSYQLDLCPTFRPDISVLLNITPDHLDRHGTMENYIAAKERIFEGRGIAVCSIDDLPSKSIHDRIFAGGHRNLNTISIGMSLENGACVQDGVLYYCLEGHKNKVGNLGGLPTLMGSHNHQNICAAYCVCREMGVSDINFMKSLKTYPGLPHRQFLCRVINGVAYINDSKATNVDAAIKAISCYKNIYLIAGGRAKEGGLSGLEDYAGHIAHAFLIGEAMDDFAGWMQKIGVPHTKSFSMDIAVLEAHKMAQSKRGEPGEAPTVLLSPACASWDQFQNFEHRGDVFQALVSSLSEDV